MSLFASRPFVLLRETAKGWIADNCPSRAAALSYYTTFSIAPILVIAAALASAFFQRDDVVTAILDQTRQLVGNDGAELIGRLLTAAAHEQNRGLAAIVGILTLLLGATTAFAELKDSLDAIWRVPKTESSGIGSLFRARLLSFGIVLAIAFLLLVSLIANTALDAFGNMFTAKFGGTFTWLARLLTSAISLVGVAILFALIFKLLPATRPSWKVAWKGAALTTVLFLGGRALIGLYLGNTATASSFGAAGSLAVLLLWVYYSALIFFFGAEFTRVASGLPASAAPAVRGDCDRSRVNPQLQAPRSAG